MSGWACRRDFGRRGRAESGNAFPVKPIEYHEAAEQELLSEIGYLEQRAPGIGRRFFMEVRRAENFIAKFPEAAEEILPSVRKRPLRKFQYSLIYTIQPSTLLILAVAHHRRRPNYWVGRTT
ncbi:MAG: type II toxin-antitoxin system RelE/ParE family toxin [Terriglobia bacterium]|nr:MAG: type II toxin-antitoxin system RelE/ParE family toxin [Terriglobia bacterium]